MPALLSTQHDDIITWADMYDTAGMRAGKMIVNYLMEKVEVYRDDKLHIDFNIAFEQFSFGMDIAGAKTKTSFLKRNEVSFCASMVEISGIEPLTS